MESRRTVLEKINEVAIGVGHLACTGIIAYGGTKVGIGAVKRLYGLNSADAERIMINGAEILLGGYTWHKILNFVHGIFNSFIEWQSGLDDRGEI